MLLASLQYPPTASDRQGNRHCRLKYIDNFSCYYWPELNYNKAPAR